MWCDPSFSAQVLATKQTIENWQKFFNNHSQQKGSHNMEGHETLGKNMQYFLVYPSVLGHLATWKDHHRLLGGIWVLACEIPR